MKISIILAIFLCQQVSINAMTTPAILATNSEELPELEDPTAMDEVTVLEEDIPAPDGTGSDEEVTATSGGNSSMEAEEAMAASRCKINYNALRLPRGLRWVTAAKGYIPRGAVSSGRYRGRRVFVARVGASPSLMVAARIIQGDREAHWAWSTKVFPASRYDILVADDPSNLRWQDLGYKKRAPYGTVVSGWACAYYAPIYVGRDVATQIAGGVESWHSFLFAFDSRRGIRSFRYQVLVYIPVDKYIITSIQYHVDRAKLLGKSSPTLYNVPAKNCAFTQQMITIEEEITITNEKSWGTSSTHKGGVSVTVEKEIEVDGFFAKARGGISVTAHYEGSKTTSFGRTESETTTRRVKFPVTVPARKVLQASLLGTKATIDIPYTATMVAYHQNKEVDRKQVTGVFKNTKTFSYSPQWGTPRPVRSSDC